MLSKKELAAEYLNKGYKNSVQINSEEILVKIKRQDGKELGCLVLDEIDNDLYEVESVSSTIRGLGKHLYYLAMARFYPSWICSDRKGCSDDAARIYKALDEVDYVEKAEIKGSLKQVNPARSLTNKMYRYKK